MDFDEDLALQLHLQEEVKAKKASCLDLPDEPPSKLKKVNHNKENDQPNCKTSLTDPSWEYIDPTPDVHSMFLQFNTRFFWGKLLTVEVKWSPRMTSCAGVCCYEGHGGLCSIRLSAPLLKLRPRKDLVETLLHEMIHAFLFVTNNDRDRDGHGPEFHKHMYRINNEAGTKISVYHDFHDEVKLYQQHWWRCNGPCQNKRPYFGMVKRAMNRPPGPSDFWWNDHKVKCGGTFTKVREPEGFNSRKGKSSEIKSKTAQDIRKFLPFNGEGNSLTVDKNSNSKISPTKGQGDSSGIVNKVNSFTPNRKLPTGNEENKISKKIMVPSGNIHTKNNSQSSESKSRPSQKGKSFGRGGMLANRGGGTLVITEREKKYQGETRANIAGMNGAISSKPTTPISFTGKGKILGSTTSKTKPAIENKPWLTRLSKIEAKASSVKTNQKSDRNKGSSTEMNKEMKIKSVLSEPCTSSNSLTMPKIPGSDKKLKKMETMNVLNYNDDYTSIMVNCPTCGILVEESNINSHLDTCIEDFSGSCEKCPICNKEISLSEINAHVNSCMDASETCQDVTTNKIINCPMCNEKLADCDLSEHLETCIQCVTEEDIHFVEEDAESDSYEGNPCALNEQIHPCPICMILCKENEMNKHLDECLSKTMIDEFKESDTLN